MESAVIIYIQEFKNKYKVTTEIDLVKALKYKGFHKVFRAYQKHTKWLNENLFLIHKSTLQYCEKHLLQFQVKEEKHYKDYVDKLKDLEYVTVINHIKN